MLFFIVMVIGAIIGFYAYKEDEYLIVACIMALIYSVICALIYTLILMAIPMNVSQTVEYVEIASLQPFNGITGSFILGSGTVADKEYYVYMKKEKNGYRREKILTNKVLIYETDKVSPRLEWTVSKYQIPSWLCPKPIARYLSYSVSTDFIMYVPKGTFIREFKIH